MTSKTCFKCGQNKAIIEFYKHSMMADGHLNKCKRCTKTDVANNYCKRRPKYSAYERARQQTKERKKKKAGYLKLYRQRHPQKDRARQMVGRAIASGKLKRKPCQVCGRVKAQAHHDDYSKPLNVKWLCFKCHREKEHNQTVTATSPELSA